jgi:hypothetical protein
MQRGQVHTLVVALVRRPRATLGHLLKNNQPDDLIQFQDGGRWCLGGDFGFQAFKLDQFHGIRRREAVCHRTMDRQSWTEIVC